MSEQAGIWQRVSTGNQDEASQLPDLVRWCEAHSYDVAARYEVHGKSAYHGKHASELDRAFADMAAGKFTVLVVWSADRIERRGALAALTLAERAREAGGRIEYVKDAHLNGANEMSDVMLSLAATMARQESKRKAERVIAKHDALRASGSVVGRAPFGYAIVKRDGRKIFVPTADGRKYVPGIFERMIDGASLRSIAAWLTAEGVKTTAGNDVWNETYIGNTLIRNPAYYGARTNAGALEMPALVSPTTWQQANAALASRVRPGRSAVKREKAMLSPVCANPGCDATGAHPSPMYRIRTRDQDYYRCTGRGPQRQGCGFMVPMAELERDVTEAMLDNQMWHVERVFVPGDDASDAIARLRERGAAAMRAGDYAAATDAMTQASALETLPRTLPHWEERTTETTEAEYFASLDSSQRREYLSAMEITADAGGVGIMPRWAVTVA